MSSRDSAKAKQSMRETVKKPIKSIWRRLQLKERNVCGEMTRSTINEEMMPRNNSMVIVNQIRRERKDPIAAAAAVAVAAVMKEVNLGIPRRDEEAHKRSIKVKSINDAIVMQSVTESERRGKEGKTKSKQTVIVMALLMRQVIQVQCA